jgi:hypothetical protein
MLETLKPSQTRQSTVLPSPTCRLRLRIRLPSGKKRTLSFKSPKGSIGGHPSCSIRIPTKGDTSVYCMLLRSHGTVVVRSWDNESTLNGRKFDIAKLKPGDKLRIAGCTISLLGGGRKKVRARRSEPLGEGFGKKLAGEIGKRLAHLENRLIARQLKLTRKLTAGQRAQTSRKWETQEIKRPIELPSAVVIEGIGSLRSAVEELRARVEDVAHGPWSNSKSAPAIDAEALLASASTQMGEILQTSLREDRNLSALKFEQISRDFARIGERLCDVERKLNLPQHDLIAQQIVPVSEAVEFVRSGLQSIEQTQLQDANRFEKLADGMDALQKSTMESLGAINERIGAIPSVSNFELALSKFSEKVEGLSREFTERFLTLDDAKSLMEKLQAATVPREIIDDRFTELGAQVAGMRGEWASFQSTTQTQLGDLTTRFESNLHEPISVASAPVNLAPFERQLEEFNGQLNEHNRKLAANDQFRLQLESRLQAAQETLNVLQTEIGKSNAIEIRVDSAVADAAAALELSNKATDDIHSVQSEFLTQLGALEDRCVFLESELARLSVAPFKQPTPQIGPFSAVSNPSPLPYQSGTFPQYETPAADQSSASPHISPYYSSEYDLENTDPELGDSAETREQPTSELDLPPPPSSLSDSAQFAALKRAAVLSRPAGEAADDQENSPDDPSSASGEDEKVAPMPTSVLDSLRRSGIWKENDTTQAENSYKDECLTSSHEPHNFAESSSIEDKPTPGDDLSALPGDLPVETHNLNAWSTTNPAPNESDDESIDAYMERLLQRVSGGTGEVTGAMAIAEHLQRAKAEATKKRDERRGIAAGKVEYTPRMAAPEKTTDLTALRELALTSANANIQNYQAANKARTANEKWLVVVVAMTCAIGLLYICVNYKSDWTYLAAGASFVVALYWAIQASFTTVIAKKLTKNNPGQDPSLAASQPQPQRRRSDLDRPVLLDEPSAGDTFQALVAERERQREETPGHENGVK